MTRKPRITFRFAVYGTIGLVTYIVFFCLLLAFKVQAHQSASGEFVYPPSCCNSAATSPTGDCAAISSRFVTARADGYHVNLGVGQHPKLHTQGYSGVIPYNLTRKSEDGQFHICLSTDGVSRFCFFAPPPGV